MILGIPSSPLLMNLFSKGGGMAENSKTHGCLLMLGSPPPDLSTSHHKKGERICLQGLPVLNVSSGGGSRDPPASLFIFSSYQEHPKFTVLEPVHKVSQLTGSLHISPVLTCLLSLTCLFLFTYFLWMCISLLNMTRDHLLRVGNRGTEGLAEFPMVTDYR